MGGVESVVSKDMHRNKAQEKFAYYDQKYIQRWVLHDEAVDLMVLKVQKINMEDHYARLYGPRVMAHRTISTEQSKRDSNINAEDTPIGPTCQLVNQDLLTEAFSSHPYARYSLNVTMGSRHGNDDTMGSEEDLHQLLQHKERKASVIWKTAFTRSKLQMLHNSGDKGESKKKPNLETLFEIYNEVIDQSNATTNDDSTRLDSSEQK